MPTPIHTVFPNTRALDEWMMRNCASCRYASPTRKVQHPEKNCVIPPWLCWMHRESKPLNDTAIAKIYGPMATMHDVMPYEAPYRCHSKKDNRGRPAHEGDQHHADTPIYPTQPMLL